MNWADAARRHGLDGRDDGSAVRAEGEEEEEEEDDVAEAMALGSFELGETGHTQIGGTRVEAVDREEEKSTGEGDVSSRLTILPLRSSTASESQGAAEGREGSSETLMEEGWDWRMCL